MDAYVFDAGDKEFEAQVIERSKQVPIVVDFWAPWCGPCRTLGPLLERLAAEHAGAFLLAKVNVDESPSLSQALRIQSIPMVVGFRDGQMVAEFVGAQPEAAVREFLRKVLPSAADALIASALQLHLDGQPDAAESSFQQALQLDPRSDRALLGLAAIQAERKHNAEALALLERIGPGPQRQPADRLAAEIRIRESASGDEPALRASIAQDPADLDARFVLGQLLAARSQYPEALDQYLEVVRRNREFREGAARKAMLDIFDLLGTGNATVDHYRSELAKLLFS